MGSVFQKLKTPFVVIQPPFRRIDARNIYRERILGDLSTSFKTCFNMKSLPVICVLALAALINLTQGKFLAKACFSPASTSDEGEAATSFRDFVPA